MFINRNGDNTIAVGNTKYSITAKEVANNFFGVGEDGSNHVWLETDELPTLDEAKILQVAKDKRIKAIDTQTSIDIELLAGDNNKQKALIAEYAMLTRIEHQGTASQVQLDRISELEVMNIAIETLKTEGNTREAQVALIEVTTTLEDALLQIDTI